MNALGHVDRLRDVQVRGKRAEKIRLVPVHFLFGDEKLDHLPDRELRGLIQISLDPVLMWGGGGLARGPLSRRASCRATWDVPLNGGSRAVPGTPPARSRPWPPPVADTP